MKGKEVDALGKDMIKDMKKRTKKAKGGEFPDLNKDGKTTYADVLKGRGAFQEGGSMK